MKIHIEDEVFCGMKYKYQIEVENKGSGDSAFPTTITIEEDCGGNYFVVDTEQYIGNSTPKLTIKTIGEWEHALLPDVFINIGNTLLKAYEILESRNELDD